MNVTKILVDLEFNEGEIQFHNLEKAHMWICKEMKNWYIVSFQATLYHLCCMFRVLIELNIEQEIVWVDLYLAAANYANKYMMR